VYCPCPKCLRCGCGRTDCVNGDEGPCECTDLRPRNPRPRNPRPRKTILLDHARRVVEKQDHPDAPGRVAKQAARLRRLADLGLPATAPLDEGEGWARYPLVRGPTMREVLAAGPLDLTQQQALTGLLTAAQVADVYIGDLHDKNLIWSGTDWIIIDCGALRRWTAERGKRQRQRFDWLSPPRAGGVS